ncbi:Stp1/IreP family PP2C-type Ser/Thr phosphatase [Bacillus methanolicus]|uniref:protein-serine/threonine phosphatase n=1 Tax=Bacillus methanolicus (strain MGA3 / ATCC 53907) TaxID=796606 RepID=I3DZ62_BACMM|nr:Stp1/IreP family PP2C-type Ser/Thr phosphatase [Bacillus methanolicus]AIE59606.1 Serine/threonine phosphatase stp [Bacillus methanolicus MGA3]EIJ79533.1 protein serine/threonine phosphatase [Bacillus methanolicus MGA3]UQD51663.1 Stp1/IreP family PP2C-type Ser/Thr phosphatase [Bacillus methanolicus]
MKAVFMTDRGKIRQHNEDNGGIYTNRSGQRLAIVVDGMGGHRAGDVASEMALLNLKEFWEQSDRIATAEQAEEWLKKHIEKINQILFNHSKSHTECEGMGTTIVAAISTDKFSTIANIGDSRCYILNESGFKQLTEDHSLVNELLRSGQISKEDAEHHPRKNVLLRALGTEESVEMDIRTIIFEEGDILLLCSDGLSNKVSQAEMEDVLKSERSLEDKATELIKLANDYGGEDNITLVIVEFSDGSELVNQG